MQASLPPNAYALWLEEQGDYVVTVKGVDWYDYGGFMVPAYLPYRYPKSSRSKSVPPQKYLV